ncbi:MAG: hypothetical protein IT258_09360 [Saprospiraceae bacterium]|nr:hypothetical protein [Saprospiraceae bacterium]
MLIDDHKMIMDLQMEFHQKFPYLKLEFYSGTHKVGETSPAKTHLDGSLLLKNVRTVHTEDDLYIREEMSVSELEQLFLNKYGLNAQVFRRSGNLWLQTSATDHWTLAEQNRKGGRSEELLEQKIEEIEDRQER